MQSNPLGDRFILSRAEHEREDRQLLADAEAAPERATRVLKSIAETLAFLASSIYADRLKNVIGALMDYPGIFVLAKDDISKSMQRALDRANHRVPFAGLGRLMTPANHMVYLGHLNDGAPVEHFAAKEFIEQLQTLAKKPELLVQVVTPAMIGQAIEYVTLQTKWSAYKYVPDLFDAVDQHPQFQDAAQKAIVKVMHMQLNQPTEESKRLGLECCRQIAQDLMLRKKFTGFLAATVETDEVIAGALSHLFSPTPGAPIAKTKLGKPTANGDAPVV